MNHYRVFFKGVLTHDLTMPILEVNLAFSHQTLLRRRYVPSDFDFPRSHRFGLIVAADTLARKIFSEKLTSITIGDFTVVVTSELVANPIVSSDVRSLVLYTVVSTGTSESLVLNALKRIMHQFLNRYSRSHLFNLKDQYLERMQAFIPRMDKEFGDLIYNADKKIRRIFSNPRPTEPHI